MEESGLFSEKINNNIDFVFINFGLEGARKSQSYLKKLRNSGMSAELYPDPIKINKQMSYANKRGAKFVIMIGEEEIKNNNMTVKNMLTGDQELLTFDQLIKIL